MPASFRNIINGAQLGNAILTGDYSKVLKESTRSAKYIKGYAQDSSIEALANSLDINKDLFKQVFGIEDKKLDAYDPYHTTDAKTEEFWYSDGGGKIDGKSVQSKYDEDTNTFKRSLYSEFGFRDQDFWYEDPFIPSFELFFNRESPFFAGDDNLTTQLGRPNCLKYFIQKYMSIDPAGYSNRLTLWTEFKNIFFKIFQDDLKGDKNRDTKYKAYYISKIAGLQNLNKKMINYGSPYSDGDKITITINEDISMMAWYLAELYNNIVYSYRNQRYAFPENLLRFDMTIQINDIRNFSMPQSSNPPAPNVSVNKDYINNKDIKNILSPKSKIVYTLHDCNFSFFESRNYGDEIEIGGYGTNLNQTPQSLSFDIYYKSVTRWSEFPLFKGIPLNPWDKYLQNAEVTQHWDQKTYYNDLDRIKSQPPEQKGYLNQKLTKATQSVVNLGLNYMDNLEKKLREVRGGVVNDLLLQFNNSTRINKIEPDNVYNVNFNNPTSLENLGKAVASNLLTDLENNIRNSANF